MELIKKIKHLINFILLYFYIRIRTGGIFIGKDAIKVLGGITAKGINTLAIPIGPISGVLTILMWGAEIYGDKKKSEAEQLNARNEISHTIDSINERYINETNNTMAIYNTYIGKKALIESALNITNSTNDGEQVNIDPIKLVYDIGELMKTGQFKTNEEALIFDANLRKVLYNGGRSTEQVDALMSEIFTMIEEGEDLGEVLKSYMPNYVDFDNETGMSLKDMDNYFKVNQSVINKAFGNLVFSDTEIATVKAQRELLETVDEDIFYNKGKRPEEILEYLSLKVGEQYGNFRADIVNGMPALMEKVIRNGIEVEIPHFYEDAEEFEKIYNLIFDEVYKSLYTGKPLGPTEISKKSAYSKYAQTKDLDKQSKLTRMFREESQETTSENMQKNLNDAVNSEASMYTRWSGETQYPSIPLVSDAKVFNKLGQQYNRGMDDYSDIDNGDTSYIGMFDTVANRLSGISDSVVDLTNSFFDNFAPMTVQAATLPSSVNGDVTNDVTQTIGPVKPNYFANSQEVMESCSEKSPSSMRETEMLEKVIDMVTEFLYSPQYKTINNMIGKDVDYDYIMKELQKEIDNAFSILPNIVNRSYC